MAAPVDQDAVENATQRRRADRRWLVAFALPLVLLAASFIQSPGLFDARLVATEVPVAETPPVLLSRTARRQLYFTTHDLLHPEAFGVEGAAVGAVAMDVAPTTERSDESLRLSTWLPQGQRFLTLRSSDGSPVPGADPTPADIAAAEAFTAHFTQPRQLARGDALVFEIPRNATARAETGIAAFALLAVARFPGNDSPDGHLGLESALGQAVSALSDLDIRSLGIACIGTLAGPATCDHDDWGVILDAVAALRSGEPEVVVLGGWARTEAGRVRKARVFGDVWRDWQREHVAPRADTITHEAPRLAIIALAGGILAALMRGLPFTFVRLVAIVIVSGGLVGSAAKLAGDFLPLWSAALEPGPALVVKAVAAFVLGALMHVVVAFDARKALLAKPEGDR